MNVRIDTAFYLSRHLNLGLIISVENVCKNKHKTLEEDHLVLKKIIKVLEKSGKSPGILSG